MKETSPTGGVTTDTYDAAGRRATMVEPRGNVAGANPSAFRWAYGYDANANQTSLTDPLGHRTTTAYDALNRPTAVTDPRGYTTTYAYDAAGNQITETNPLGQATHSAYDSRAGSPRSPTPGQDHHLRLRRQGQQDDPDHARRLGHHLVLRRRGAA